MTVAASNTTEESQIRVLIDDRVNAARAKDAVALVANHAPEVVTFDVVNHLQNIGADAVKQRAEQWFASFQGPIDSRSRSCALPEEKKLHFAGRRGLRRRMTVSCS